MDINICKIVNQGLTIDDLEYGDIFFDAKNNVVGMKIVDIHGYNIVDLEDGSIHAYSDEEIEKLNVTLTKIKD